MEKSHDPTSLSTSSSQGGMFEQRDFDERETETVVLSAMGVVLEKEGLHPRDVAAAGVPLFGQQAVNSQLANTICRVADQLDADDDFKRGTTHVDIRDEQGAYDVFRQVSWNVVFHSGGITWARIAGLLVLAGKLAAKVLRTVPSLLSIIKDWTSRFIHDYLWRWIADSGGWNGIEDNEGSQISKKTVSFLMVGSGLTFGVGVLLGYWLHS